MKENYDVIIVGTGAAGLYCALNLPSQNESTGADQTAGGSVRLLSGTGRYLHAQRRRRL